METPDLEPGIVGNPYKSGYKEHQAKQVDCSDNTTPISPHLQLVGVTVTQWQATNYNYFMYLLQLQIKKVNHDRLQEGPVAPTIHQLSCNPIFNWCSRFVNYVKL